MKILVTGAAGFIGAHIASQLIRSGHQVFPLDNLDSYYSSELKMRRFQALISQSVGQSTAKLYEMDINSEEFSTFYSNNSFDVVIHLAAQAGVRLGLRDSSKYVQNNINGFINVSKLVLRHSTPVLLYASSSSVYGENAKVPFTEKDRNLLPKSLYGLTKITNELFAKSILSNEGVKSRGLRFFSVYGPWGRPDMAYFRAAASALQGKKFVRFGDGSKRRDFTFIDDISDSIEALMAELTLREPGFSDVVNIGGGSPKTLNELIQTVEDVSGKKINLENESSSPEDLEITMADFSYLRDLTGKSEFTPFQTGMKSILDWMQDLEIKQELEKWIRSTL